MLHDTIVSGGEEFDEAIEAGWSNSFRKAFQVFEHSGSLVHT